MADSAETHRRRVRQLVYGACFVVIALAVSIVSVPWWSHLYASNPVSFDLLLIISILTSIASNLVANKITIAHIKKVGFEGEGNPFARFLYKRFGFGSGYIQAVLALPLIYAVPLFFFVELHFVTLSFFFALFPLLLSYDALQDYLVARRRDHFPS